MQAIRRCGLQQGRTQREFRASRKTRVPPPVFAEQRRRAQLSQFSLKHSPFCHTHFHDVLFIQICHLCALHWAKIAFSVCQKCSVTQKYVKNAFPVGPSRTPLGQLTTLPRPLVGWGGDTPPKPHLTQRIRRSLLNGFYSYFHTISGLVVI